MKYLLWALYNRKKSLFVLAACIAAVVIWRVSTPGHQKIKNCILLIGDGMGPQEIGLALAFASDAPERLLPVKKLNLDKMMESGVLGLMRTAPYRCLVTDSAASGTQIATGRFSRPGMVGLDYRGVTVETIIEKARRAGKRTALISDTRITHATPASFAAHVPRRSMENVIAMQLAREGADIMLSGGLRHWLPESVNRRGSDLHGKYRRMIPGTLSLKSSRKDDQEPLEITQKRGYRLVFDREQLKRVSGNKVLGLFAGSVMPDGIRVSRTRNDRTRTIPTLLEMTRKALELLGSHEEGFFMMVEAGLIDWAGHHNDAGRLIHEMMVLDDALGEIMRWAAGRNDTMVIVAADHETGNFGFSYSRYNIPPGIILKRGAFGGKKWSPAYNYGNPEVLKMIYNQSKSFEEILREFDGLPKYRQTAGNFRQLFNNAVAFHITTEQAEDILRTVPNPRFDPKNRKYGGTLIPLVKDFSDFYVAGMENRTNLMGRAIARQQGIVWATGTHTATPVLVIAWGPGESPSLFNGVFHSIDLNRSMLKILGIR